MSAGKPNSFPFATSFSSGTFVAGCVVALGQIGQAAAISALIFSSLAVSGDNLLLQLFLTASVVMSLVVAFGRDLPAPVYITIQNAPIAVLLPAFAAMAATDLDPATAQATTWAILGIAGLVTGLAITALWAFDLGRLINLLPFPVSAGFLAGSGAILALEALRSLLPSGGTSLADLATPAAAAAFGLMLFVARKLAPRIGLVGLLIAGIAAVHLGLVLTGTDLETARALGILSPVADAPSPVTDIAGHWRQVDWTIVQGSAAFIGACAFVAVIGSMLNLAGIEMILGRDIRAAAVLSRLGAMNVIGGGLGVPPSYPSASLSGVGGEIDGHGRAPIFIYCLILLLAVAFVGPIVELLPRFVMVGLLVFIGLSLLDRWFLRLRRRMRWTEWLLTASVVISMPVFGILFAIQLGIVAASILFVASYARLRVVRDIRDMTTLRSRVDRGPAQTTELDDKGAQILVLSVQGYLFFGSVEQIADTLRRLMEERPDTRRIILDLSRVRDIDSAASEAFGKIERLSNQNGIGVVLTGLSAPIENLLIRAALLEPDTRLTRTASLDAALEDAETLLLSRDTEPQDEEDARSTLIRQLGSDEMTDRLLQLMERRAVPMGTKLVRAGEDTHDIYFVDAGRLAIEVKGPDQTPTRLRSVRPGAFVGEMAGYLGQPRSADVVAETDAVVYRIGPDVLETLQKTDADLLAGFHKMMASALAEKLDRTTRMLREATQ